MKYLNAFLQQGFDDEQRADRLPGVDVMQACRIAGKTWLRQQYSSMLRGCAIPQDHLRSENDSCALATFRI